MKTLYYILRTCRPKQWTKNLLVFAGLVFSHEAFQTQKIIVALLAFVSFCLVSSSVYLMNDIVDREKDALHPRKRHRPIAAGLLSPWIAFIAFLFCLSGGLSLAFYLQRDFGLLVFLYVLLNFAYSFRLKKVVIVDVIIIASGFMLRILGGTAAINEPASSWLIICASFLTLFLALGKRRAELVNLGEHAQDVRKTLALYTPRFLNNLINIVITGCIMSYALYTLDNTTVLKFGANRLVWTVPFVIYGLFRYLYLLEVKQQGEAPEETIFKDIPLLIDICLFAVVVFSAVYF